MAWENIVSSIPQGSHMVLPVSSIHPSIISSLMQGDKALRIVATFDADGRLDGHVYVRCRAQHVVVLLPIDALARLADETDDAHAAALMRGLLAQYRAEQQPDTSDRTARGDA